jgi:hypothetical protein
MKTDGRSFDCSTCKQTIKNLRRCGEDRFDFNADDGPFWPIQLYQGGELYGFCPAKATWDFEAVSIFRLLIVAAETGNINLIVGGIMDQPDWWVEQISWFIPKYKQLQFVQKVRMVLGDGKSSSIKPPRARK